MKRATIFTATPSRTFFGQANRTLMFFRVVFFFVAVFSELEGTLEKAGDISAGSLMTVSPLFFKEHSSFLQIFLAPLPSMRGNAAPENVHFLNCLFLNG